MIAGAGSLALACCGSLAVADDTAADEARPSIGAGDLDAAFQPPADGPRRGGDGPRPGGGEGTRGDGPRGEGPRTGGDGPRPLGPGRPGPDGPGPGEGGPGD